MGYFLDRAGELLRESKDLLQERGKLQQLLQLKLASPEESKSIRNEIDEDEKKIHVKTAMALSLIAISKAILIQRQDERPATTSNRPKRKAAAKAVRQDGPSGQAPAEQPRPS